MIVYLLKKETKKEYKSGEIVRSISPELALAHKENGAPYFENGPYISITDTKGWWACCMSQLPCGIDMEEKNREVKPALVKRFHPFEQQYLSGLDEGGKEWQLEALQIWTRKEACMKISEEGLARQLKSFSVIDETLDYCNIAGGHYIPVNHPSLIINILTADPSECDASIERLSYKPAPKTTALEQATAYIADRAYASSELYDKLVKKGYAREDAAEAVAALTERGYLDDSAYAQRYINRAHRDGKGSARILQELKLKGISTETAKELLNESDFNEEDAAFEIAQKLWANGIAKIDANDRKSLEKLKSKIAGKLASSGYSSAIIYKIIIKFE